VRWLAGLAVLWKRNDVTSFYANQKGDTIRQRSFFYHVYLLQLAVINRNYQQL